MKFWALLLFSWLSTLGAFAHQRCGSQAGGALCAGGQCCSIFGFCGSTPAYCTHGCQSQCTSGGSPSTPTPSTLTPTPTGGGGEECGSKAGGALCAGGLCCSKLGFCGSTPDFCTEGCQSQCTSGDNSSLITQVLFDKMLKHRNDANCPGRGFYTYDDFIAATKSFEAFGTTGDTDTRKREIAAFLAQTSHETTGGWESAPDGPYAWGYCYVQVQGDPGDYCVASNEWPCATGKKYYGRGPFQISYNYNYGQAGKAINYDLLNNPDAVATDATISFKTALWFWMTPQSPKPSCHEVITGNWTPSTNDTAAGRVPGYGLITNIINGGEECGNGSNPKMENRIGFYNRYCDILGVTYGANLDCSIQSPFA